MRADAPLTGRMLAFSEIERVLVVTAHPDDVDFGAAGTIAALTDAGVEVTYCLVTDGQAGGFDHSIPRTEMASIRRDEQTKAAAEVGVTDLRFAGMPCAAVEDWKVQEVWIQAGPMGGDPDLAVVDITEQVDRKFRALRCHVSQHVDPDAMMERVGARFQQLAVEHGLPEGSSAELFYICDTR